MSVNAQVLSYVTVLSLIGSKYVVVAGHSSNRLKTITFSGLWCSNTVSS